MARQKKKAIRSVGTGNKKETRVTAIAASTQQPEARVKKEQITLRLDADVVEFFRAKGNGYQTQINHCLGVAMSDAKIRDAAERPGTPWYEESRSQGAISSRLFRPKKEQITLRLDAELVDYFRERGKGYQSRMNRFLRLMMVELLRSEKPQPDTK